MSELHAASCTLLFKCSLYLDISPLQRTLKCTSQTLMWTLKIKTLLEESLHIVSIFFFFKFTENGSVSTGYPRKAFCVILRKNASKKLCWKCWEMSLAGCTCSVACLRSVNRRGSQCTKKVQKSCNTLLKVIFKKSVWKTNFICTQSRFNASAQQKTLEVIIQMNTMICLQ